MRVAAPVPSGVSETIAESLGLDKESPMPKRHPYSDTPQFRQSRPHVWTRDISVPDQPTPRTPEQQREWERKSFVYFVQAGDSGPIKIGHTRDVDRRIASMRTGNHEELRLRLVVAGGWVTERELHRRFADAHKRGEWFHPAPELLDFIQDPTPVLDDAWAAEWERGRAA